MRYLSKERRKKECTHEQDKHFRYKRKHKQNEPKRRKYEDRSKKAQLHA